VDGSELCERLVASVQDCAIVVLDPDGCVTTWGAGAQVLEGYERSRVVGQYYAVFFPPEDAAAGVPGRYLDEARAAGHVKFEGWRVRADGSRFWAEVSLTALHDDQSRLQGFGEITRDVTKSRRFQQELMRRALHDPLTGAANRVLLHDRLGHALGRLERSPGGLAVFFVDLDGFKAVNDTWGHQAGDRLLVTVAERMRSAVRAHDTVARVGGDEFVVLCEGLEAQDATVRIAQRLVATLSSPLGDAAGDDLQIRASIGVAWTEDAAVEPQTLLHAADARMYGVKRERGAGVRVSFRDCVS
jgi:diguanylate cyclase (GGDEF)-like protein/PAS domain S-box-containing protein